jgi:hypothetical protein
MSGYRPRKTPAAVRKQKAASELSSGSAVIPTAILAGTFAALASVFAKLTLDVRTVDFLQRACNTLVAPTTPYCTSLFVANEGETSPVRAPRLGAAHDVTCINHDPHPTALCLINNIHWILVDRRGC